MSSASIFRRVLSRDLGNGGRRAFEITFFVILAFLGYVLSFSEMPIDDEARFTPLLEQGRTRWDAAHLLMEPAVWAWHSLFGTPGQAIISQKLANSAFAAGYVGVAAWMFIGCGFSRLGRVVALLTTGFSLSVLHLASSGHIKMTSAPWFALSLAILVAWERRLFLGTPCRNYVATALGGAALGIAACFLLSFAMAIPFVGLAVLLVCLRSRMQPVQAIGHAAVFVLTASLVMGLLMTLGFVLSEEGPRTWTGFAHWFFQKSTEFQGGGSALVELLRLGFGVANGIIYSGDVGAIVRAALAGDDIRWQQAAAEILLYGGCLLISVVFIAAAMIVACLKAVRGEAPNLVMLAAFLAMVLFAYAWHFLEAEFIYPLALPLAFFAATAVDGTQQFKYIAVVSCAAMLGSNFLGYALPRIGHDRVAYQDTLNAILGPEDLVIGSSTWSGRPVNLSAFELGEVSRLWVDVEAANFREGEALIRHIEDTATRTLERGGKVYVFDLLDENNWNSPWPLLHKMGMKKSALRLALQRDFELRSLGTVAGMQGWLVARKLGPLQ